MNRNAAGDIPGGVSSRATKSAILFCRAKPRFRSTGPWPTSGLVVLELSLAAHDPRRTSTALARQVSGENQASVAAPKDCRHWGLPRDPKPWGAAERHGARDGGRR